MTIYIKFAICVLIVALIIGGLHFLFSSKHQHIHEKGKLWDSYISSFVTMLLTLTVGLFLVHINKIVEKKELLPILTNNMKKVGKELHKGLNIVGINSKGNLIAKYVSTVFPTGAMEEAIRSKVFSAEVSDHLSTLLVYFAAHQRLRDGLQLFATVQLKEIEIKTPLVLGTLKDTSIGIEIHRQQILSQIGIVQESLGLEKLECSHFHGLQGKFLLKKKAGKEAEEPNTANMGIECKLPTIYSTP